MSDDQPVTREDVERIIDQTGVQWVDSFAQNLLLTVQALQQLHTAFDEKFTR